MSKPKKKPRQKTAGPVLVSHLAVKCWRLPNELRAVVPSIFKRWEWLLPTWVHEIIIAYNPDIPGNVSARILCSPQYRRCELEIGPAFLRLDYQEREDAICHELIHSNLGPMQRYCEQLLAAVKEHVGGEVEAVYSGVYHDAVEQTTCDLTNAIHGRLNELGTKQ